MGNFAVQLKFPGEKIPGDETSAIRGRYVYTLPKFDSILVSHLPTIDFIPLLIRVFHSQILLLNER